jgi:hypothetical protein
MDRGVGYAGRLVVLLACVVALVALLGMVSAGSARASGVECVNCTGSYSGTWTANVQYFNGASASLTMLNWTETLVPGSAASGGYSAWDLTSASGTVTFNQPSDGDSCSASLSPNPQVADGLLNTFGPQVEEGSDTTIDPWPPSWWSSIAGATGPALISTPSTGDSNCDFTSSETAYEDGGWSFSGAGCNTEISVPTGSTETVPDDCTGKYSDAFGNKGTGTLQSTLTISTLGTCTCSCGAAAVTARAGGRGARAARRTGARAASGGSLSANVIGLPGQFPGQTSLLAISAGDGRIVAARALARGATRTVLSLPSDRYAILADAESPAGRSHNHDGIGPLVAVHPGRRATVRVVLGRPAAAAGVLRSRAVPGRREAGYPRVGQPFAVAAAVSGPVVTVNGINLTLPDGSRVSLDDPALTDLFPVWHDQDGITFVETGKQFTDFAQREQDLSDSGRLGQPYHFDPITPDFTISGDARIDRKGRMSITIELRDRCSGQIIARITITRRLHGGPGSIRYDLGVAAALADALSRLQPPSATGGCGCANA